MDNATFLLNAANIITSIATLGALVAVAIEIRSSRIADKRNATFQLLDKFQLALDQMPIVAKTGREDFVGYFDEYPAGTKERAALVKIINFFQTVAGLSFDGLIDRKAAIGEFGEIAVSWWQKLETMTKEHRKDDKDRYIYFEWFALAAKKKGAAIDDDVKAELASLRKENLFKVP
jgi:hypothetical protein